MSPWTFTSDLYVNIKGYFILGYKKHVGIGIKDLQGKKSDMTKYNDRNETLQYVN